MDNIEMPALTDIPDIPFKDLQRPLKKRNAIYVSEHIDEVEKLLVKTNISNILTLIDDCEEPIEIKKMMSILKNMIILHGKILKKMPTFIKTIEGFVQQFELRYDTCVIYKMLYNITNNHLQDNIHFRFVDEDIQKYPSMSTEDRIILEKKIINIRFAYQSKKKHEAFKVGQIVGAKDKEMKWWLARILHVHNDEERAGFWYYIRFEGWGSIHDEWIYSETFRVKWYNPRKHFLKK